MMRLENLTQQEVCSMDMQKAPPIQYLKTFVMAAKHMSFKEAAFELYLTPSAISQQIKSLETHLSTSLFNRDKKQLTLTSAGSRFLSLAEHVIQEYETGFQDFISSQKKQPIKLTTTTYLANQYLIPNLASFHNTNPNIKLALQASESYVSLEKHALDAAIRFTAKPDANARLISPAYLALACSPDYFERKELADEINWQIQSLIHCRPEHDDWWRYFKSETKLTHAEYKTIASEHFDSYEAGIQAAKAGLGITLAILPLSKHELEKEELIALSGTKIQLEAAFYLITREKTQRHQESDALFTWIKALLKF